MKTLNLDIMKSLLSLKFLLPALLFAGVNFHSRASVSFTENFGWEEALDDSILLIQHLTFEGTFEGEQVHLKWESIKQIDVDRYEIYKSVDGSNWELIHSENGAVTNEFSVTYEVTDVIEKMEIYYYAVREIDLDGNVSNEKMISIDCRGDQNVLVYPNPSNNFIVIKGGSESSFHVRDEQGKVMMSGRNASEVLKLSIETLMPGRYFVEIDGEQFPFVKLD